MNAFDAAAPAAGRAVPIEVGALDFQASVVVTFSYSA